jgi:hypothetical protein
MAAGHREVPAQLDLAHLGRDSLAERATIGRDEPLDALDDPAVPDTFVLAGMVRMAASVRAIRVARCVSAGVKTLRNRLASAGIASPSSTTPTGVGYGDGGLMRVRS